MIFTRWEVLIPSFLGRNVAAREKANPYPLALHRGHGRYSSPAFVDDRLYLCDLKDMTICYDLRKKAQ
jgi:hypothetical protein